MTLETKASKYIADWDEYDGEITIYLKKPYVLSGMRAAQFSEFIDDFGDEEKCLSNMYERIIDEVKKINSKDWENGAA